MWQAFSGGNATYTYTFTHPRKEPRKTKETFAPISNMAKLLVCLGLLARNRHNVKVAYHGAAQGNTGKDPSSFSLFGSPELILLPRSKVSILRKWLCSSWLAGTPVSASPLLGLQACTTTLSSFYIGSVSQALCQLNYFSSSRCLNFVLLLLIPHVKYINYSDKYWRPHTSTNLFYSININPELNALKLDLESEQTFHSCHMLDVFRVGGKSIQLSAFILLRHLFLHWFTAAKTAAVELGRFPD